MAARESTDIRSKLPTPKFSMGIGAYVCLFCDSVIPVERGSQRYCSDDCADLFHEQHAQSKSYPKGSGPRHIRKNKHYPELPSGTLGAMNELLVAADLMARGLPVFRAMSPTSPCDLIVIHDGKLLRVEVTTGRREPNGRLAWAHHIAERFDVVAIVTHGEGVRYAPDIFGQPGIATFGVRRTDINAN